MATTKNRLPDCGLYRTTRPLPGHEDSIPAGILVNFHNHGENGAGLPTVCAPDHNVMNVWHFHGPPTEFRGLTWAETLEKLPPEGYYTLRRALNFDGGNWPKGTIVQLGYNQSADGIIFIGRLRSRRDENDLFFSNEGIKLTKEQMTMLEPAVVLTDPNDGHPSGQEH